MRSNSGEIFRQVIKKGEFIIVAYKRSPINYMGGKYRSLKNIIPNFAEDIDTFYDLFSGSGTVHLNTNANKIVSNDINDIVVDLQEYISKSEPESLYEQLKELAEEYKLSGQDSEGYIALRKEFNVDRDMLKLLALSQHSFNYLIRFNKQGGFNASHGKGISKLSQDFLEKLVNFKEHAKASATEFTSKDFRHAIDLGEVQKNDLIYCDPPYLLSEAVYNEKRAFGGWGKGDTEDLLTLLVEIDKRGSRFALSEMISSKGRVNEVLAKWVEDNGYSINYNNVKYLGVPSTHNNDRKSVEVLVTNY